MFVLAAAKEKKLIGKSNFNAPALATPIAANGALFVATDGWLYALREGK
jgi:hypothetical protein